MARRCFLAFSHISFKLLFIKADVLDLFECFQLKRLNVALRKSFLLVKMEAAVKETDVTETNRFLVGGDKNPKEA